MKKYRRFSDIQYVRPNLEELQSQYEQLAATINVADATGLLAAFNQWTDIKSKWRTMKTLNQIHYFQDTRNPSVKRENQFIGDNVHQIRKWDINIERLLLAHSHRLALEDEYGSIIFDVMTTDIETFGEDIAEHLANEERLLTEYVGLVSRKGNEIAGEPSITEQIDSVYDDLVRVRDEMATKLGYQNYIELGYKVTKLMAITPTDVEGFRNEVRKHVAPWLSELRQRSKSVWQKVPDPVPKGDWKFIVKQAARMFHEMSSEMGRFFDMLLEYELFDLGNRDSMRDWAEAFFLPSYRLPFIFCKFGGSWGDIMEFIHECGHGFMYYCLADDNRFEYLPTSEAHEIHGMSLVSLAYPWMELFFEDGADICRYNKYFGKIYALVFFCCLDEFEHFVYNNPICGLRERNRFWIHLEEKYQLKRYVAESPNETEEGRGWQEWEVIFSLPFYSIGYALSGVAAQQFWMRAASDRDEAISDYVNLCQASASMSFFHLLKVGNLKSPFQEGLLEELVEYGRQWTRKTRRAIE